MAEEMIGSTGRQLRVWLDRREYRVEALDPERLHKYLGGTGYACRLLYDELAPGVDPLGPLNKVVFATGPLCSNTVPGGGSVELCFKSPLTGAWGESRAGSDFGPDLRRAGFDHLIVEGRSEEPVCLVVQDGRVEFRPAGQLLGLTVGEKIARIGAELPEGRFTIGAIGPAGERRVKFASVMFGDRAAGRCGAGAVLGAKNLLAVAVGGTGKVEPGDQEALKAALRHAMATLKEHPATAAFRAHGTMGDYTGNDEKGDFPTRNWQANSWGKGVELFDRYEAENFVKPYPCYRGCPISCARKAQVAQGPYQTPVHGGAEYETMACFTAYVLNEDVDAAVHCGWLCNQMGLDTISTGAVIAFAMECFENGLFTQEQLGGLDLTWGNAAVLPTLVRMIAHREGIGDLLADGVRLAAQRIGRGAEAFAVHVKGLEGPAHDGRSGKALALSYGTGNRGMCHIHPVEAMAWDAGKMDWGLQKYGLPDPNQVDRWSEAGKAPAVKLLQDGLSLPDILCTCKFFMYAGITVDHWAELLSALTGRPYTGEDLLAVAERTCTLQRLFNLREGLTAADDQIPERAKAVPASGRYQGEAACAVLDFDAMLRDYYRVRGWDPDTGVPLETTLERLQIP
ncbi:MAG: aldehyde ferredoxin oxidoreductase family protein [Holophaga sp.]|jgi:aldehyde:ferredoxin oxidoreductase